MAQIPEGSESQLVDMLVIILTMIVRVVVRVSYYMLAAVRYALRVGHLVYMRGREVQRDPVVRERTAAAVNAVRQAGAGFASSVGSVGNLSPSGGPVVVKSEEVVPGTRLMSSVTAIIDSACLDHVTSGDLVGSRPEGSGKGKSRAAAPDDDNEG